MGSMPKLLLSWSSHASRAGFLATDVAFGPVHPREEPLEPVQQFAEQRVTAPKCRICGGLGLQLLERDHSECFALHLSVLVALGSCHAALQPLPERKRRRLNGLRLLLSLELAGQLLGFTPLHAIEALLHSTRELFIRQLLSITAHHGLQKCFLLCRCWRCRCNLRNGWGRARRLLRWLRAVAEYSLHRAGQGSGNGARTHTCGDGTSGSCCRCR
mmetsp:Transcript_9716/g.35586  ORF Transcript_9716/g.35586 Transcript_9716/m.35586 type:complete len:215 (+) Transcript_9716:1394-2038(+)